MKKALILCICLFFMLAFTSCTQEAILRIKNSTTSMIWFELDGGNTTYLGAYSYWSKSYTSDRSVLVHYSGDHVFAASAVVDVQKDRTTTFDVMATGGAIKLFNTSTTTITQVYISPKNSNDWGQNQLSSSLLPNLTTLWTVTEDTWDIKVVDNVGNSLYVFNQYIQKDSTLSINFSTKSQNEYKFKLSGGDSLTGSTSRIEQKY